ncbi:MAG: RluA family pseudouridine synthase [Anaerolineae bacterium]|nr:RluA family pseudouridine synthase [Anaerolineae bacterium]
MTGADSGPPLRIQVGQAAPRIDYFLAQSLPDLSRSQIKKLIAEGRVLRVAAGSEARPVKPSDSVEPGDVIMIQLPAAPDPAIAAENIPLEVVFEDAWLAVISKPAGMVVHPAQGHSSGTLVNALLARYPELARFREPDDLPGDRPGIVHRLDRDTSGLIVIARTLEALHHLQQQFKTRQVEKTYLALVDGTPAVPEGIIDVPLGRDPRHRQKMAPRTDGKPARTHYRLIEQFEQHSLLEIGLETGRTHQIRVHLAWLNCPVVGDTVYGRKKNRLGLKRQFLHAWRLRFRHPADGRRLELKAPLVESLNLVLQRLREEQ